MTGIINIIANPVYEDYEIIGAFIVIINIMETIQHEQMCREFTSNVLHELSEEIAEHLNLQADKRNIKINILGGKVQIDGVYVMGHAKGEKGISRVIMGLEGTRKNFGGTYTGL